MAFQNPTPVVFSLIVPLRNEADSLESFHRQLTDEVRKLKESYEIVYVDDGSSDQTVKVLERIVLDDEDVAVVELSASFGSAAAVTAGAAMARGGAVITFDRRCPKWADLMPRMIAAWREGAEIVHVGGRPRRRGALREALTAVDRGDRVHMRLLDAAVIAALRPVDVTRTIDQQIGHLGFRQMRLEGASGAERALQPANRPCLAAPGRLANWGLAIAGVLLGGGTAFYLVSLALLLAGVNTGVESRVMAVVAALVGMELGLLATVGRFVACASMRLSRRPTYAVRRVHGLVEADQPLAAEPAGDEFGSYVVFT
jgi:polyisoprenyl-phosphate glycosyltransferase